MEDRYADDVVSNRHRQEIAGVIGDLMQRAAHEASDRLRKLSGVRRAPKASPLLAVVCSDQLMLTESQPTKSLQSLDGYLQSRFRTDAETLAAMLKRSIERLSRLMARRSEFAELLAVASSTSIDLTEPKTLLEPRLLKVLSRAELLESIGLSKARAKVCSKLGLDLKRFELLAALRRRIITMDRESNQLVLSEGSSKGPIAPTTRPFDFTVPGVVDNSVRRFGLIYDLTNFTAILEDVRKTGRIAEEKALQFMYVFQNRLEEIRQGNRLIFEKFLGDGAFYSSRRALRILSAACEIRQVYHGLRRSGFPFDQGIRMALNHSVYRLLPMLDSDHQIQRFEFFGHGIVELARLTTGKSTREVAEIAEFLIHAGFPAVEVENFLAPIATARSAGSPSGTRDYAATIDGHGELVNEGIVLTFDFLKHLETELEVAAFTEITVDGVSWLLFPLDPERSDQSHVGLRYLGVARLKGLAPLELVEAEVWPEIPDGGRAIPKEVSLIDLLRRLANPGGSPTGGEEIAETTIDEDLVVVSYLDGEGGRQWVFGRHRPGDDVLLQAIQMPMQIPTIDEDEPLETWLFRNRYELERLYLGLRRNDPGATIPVTPLRRSSGYVGCYLAAPHKAP
jgi:hypothetical protein